MRWEVVGPIHTIYAMKDALDVVEELDAFVANRAYPSQAPFRAEAHGQRFRLLHLLTLQEAIERAYGLAMFLATEKEKEAVR